MTLKRKSPQLGFGVFRRARGDRLAKLTKLLVDLRPDILGLLPVEAHTTCLVLYAVGLNEGGQRGGDTREDGLIPAFLLLLQFLPNAPRQPQQKLLPPRHRHAGGGR